MPRFEKKLLFSDRLLGLKGVGLEPGPYSATIPHLLFSAFQLMFAVITPALITGAFAERIKFSAFLIFTVLWSTLVYFPVCHWVWGGGWISGHGGLDFAGGTVIHINSGAAALVAALMVGKRKGWGKDAIHPHNLSMTILGAGILWFGWFGFNAGSALAANGSAANAFFVTQVAAGCAALSWIPHSTPLFAVWRLIFSKSRRRMCRCKDFLCEAKCLDVSSLGRG